MAEQTKMSEYTETIATMRGGAADRAASSALRKVVEAVIATGKGGAVTFKLSIKPLKDGDGELEVTAKIGITLPAEDIKTAIYYADDNNHLIRTDPRQASMLLDRTEPRQREEGDINQLGRGRVIEGEFARG